MFGAEKGDKVRYFVFGQGVAEPRHVLSAIRDLVLDLLRIQPLSYVRKRGSFICALRIGAMAICAPFIVEQLRSSNSLVIDSEGWSAGEGERKQNEQCRIRLRLSAPNDHA